jgi:hypothetical protein
MLRQVLRGDKNLLNEVAAALPQIKAEEDEQADEDPDDEPSAAPTNPTVEAVNVLMAALRNWARALAEGRQTIGGQSGRTIQLIKSRLPPDRPPTYGDRKVLARPQASSA